MLIRLLIQRLRANQQFSFRAGVHRVGRFFRVIGLLSLDYAVLLLLLRGLEVHTESPAPYFVNAAVTYLFARLLLRGQGKPESTRDKKSGGKTNANPQAT